MISKGAFFVWLWESGSLPRDEVSSRLADWLSSSQRTRFRNLSLFSNQWIPERDWYLLEVQSTSFPTPGSASSWAKNCLAPSSLPT